MISRCRNLACIARIRRIKRIGKNASPVRLDASDSGQGHEKRKLRVNERWRKPGSVEESEETESRNLYPRGRKYMRMTGGHSSEWPDGNCRDAGGSKGQGSPCKRYVPYRDRTERIGVVVMAQDITERWGPRAALKR